MKGYQCNKCGTFKAQSVPGGVFTYNSLDENGKPNPGKAADLCDDCAPVYAVEFGLIADIDPFAEMPDA